MMGFLNWPYVEGKSAWGELTSITRFVLLKRDPQNALIDLNQ
jgi:hypothetical protein